MNVYFESLWDIYSQPEQHLVAKYRKLRGWFERLCRETTENESLQMTDLAARINFLGACYSMDKAQQYKLHSFRINSNEILNRRKEPSHSLFLSDIKTLSFAVRKLTGEEIPPPLYKILPQRESSHVWPSAPEGKIKRVRVCFLYADETFLYVNPVDFLTDSLWRVRYNVTGVNDMFASIVPRLWKYARLNLLDVSLEEKSVCTPSLIVLEPDYLIDISSLAECFKEYGSHPANYLLSRLVPIDNPRPLLLGNIVNLFLDEWIHAEAEPDYRECMRKAFRSYPVELASCDDLMDKEKEKQFFSDCLMHFEHIRRTVKETFGAPGYNLNPKDAVLEPSYICEALGIQGRLDYMQRDMHSFIEMKSGKADEYAIKGKIEPKENNRVQMLLYMAVLEFSMGKDHKTVHPYLLYTRYPLLYPASTSWMQVKRIINVRNSIVANEYEIQLQSNTAFTARKLGEINSGLLNERTLSGKYWEQYLAPSIEKFTEKYSSLNALEQTYFNALYSFVTKELYVSKTGGTDSERRLGSASLWLSCLEQKRETGDILFDLTITENCASDKDQPILTFSIPVYEDEFSANFRTGDAVILYERNTPEDKVSNKMVFKGNIAMLEQDKIVVRLRAAQRNISVFTHNSRYAVEHDVMDTTFRSMYHSLYAFMTANNERRELLLSQRPPAFDDKLLVKATQACDDFERVTLKAVAAKDYFLLVGPPGTGKTSRALKRMVEELHDTHGNQILLLAYTNRAVDEICKALTSITPAVNFIRIGGSLSCDVKFRKYLLENQLLQCMRRKEVQEQITRCRILVGTVASVAAKPELFRLKTFDTVIIDEATQILEPQLLGILCARNAKGENAVGRFVMIGDHKQLPAVVLQTEQQSAVEEKILNEIGLFNLRDSLFERLYRSLCGKEQFTAVTDMLCKQGRMNPEVAFYSNKAFYDGKLLSVGLIHQTEALQMPQGWGKDEWEHVLNRRVAFISSKQDKESVSGKTNKHEAVIAAKLAAKVYNCYHPTFSPDKTLGIITPYRSQIALIKKELSLLSVPELNGISVDTVERYQGSERDVIIYSFCVNHSYQLKFLPNLIKEGQTMIDRKLNVALTRARKQLYIIGVPKLLCQDPVYQNLLHLMKSRGDFMDLHVC